MERFLARQPIFNWRRVVYGYELLFRSGLDNFFSHVDGDAASASTADTMILFGIDRLTEGKRAFLNCTREFLVRDYAMLLPKDRVVIEVLESVKLDEELIAACRARYEVSVEEISVTTEDVRFNLPRALTA